jgi:hypothetical protein
MVRKAVCVLRHSGMRTAVRSARAQRQHRPPRFVIERHPLGDEHEDHLGTATWRKPWRAFTAALRLGLVNVIEEVKRVREQPREVHVDEHIPGAIAIKLGLVPRFALALVKWSQRRRAA